MVCKKFSNLVACEASVSAQVRRESQDETKKEERTFIISTNNQIYLLENGTQSLKLISKFGLKDPFGTFGPANRA